MKNTTRQGAETTMTVTRNPKHFRFVNVGQTSIEAIVMPDDCIRGSMRSKRGTHRVQGAITLKEGNSLGAPKGLIAFTSRNHGTKMYTFDHEGGLWSSNKQTAYQYACNYGLLMISAS